MSQSLKFSFRSLLAVYILLSGSNLWAITCQDYFMNLAVANYLNDSIVESDQVQEISLLERSQYRLHILEALEVLPPVVQTELIDAGLKINIVLDSVSEIEGNQFDDEFAYGDQNRNVNGSKGLVAINKQTGKWELTVKISELFKSPTSSSTVLHELFHLYSVAWGVNRIDIHNGEFRVIHNEPLFASLFGPFGDPHDLDKEYFGRFQPEAFAEFQARFFTSLLWREFLKREYPKVYEKLVEVYGINSPVLVDTIQYPLPEGSRIISLAQARGADEIYILGRDLHSKDVTQNLPDEVLRNLDHIYKFQVTENIYGVLILKSEDGFDITIAKRFPFSVPVVVIE